MVGSICSSQSIRSASGAIPPKGLPDKPFTPSILLPAAIAALCVPCELFLSDFTRVVSSITFGSVTMPGPSSTVPTVTFSEGSFRLPPIYAVLMRRLPSLSLNMG